MMAPCRVLWCTQTRRLRNGPRRAKRNSAAVSGALRDILGGVSPSTGAGPAQESA